MIIVVSRSAKIMKQTIRMVHHSGLIRRTSEETAHVGVVAVGHNAAIGEVAGKEVFRPETVVTVVNLRGEGAKKTGPGPSRSFVVAVIPCFLRVTLQAVDQNNAAIDGDSALLLVRLRALLLYYSLRRIMKDCEALIMHLHSCPRGPYRPISRYLDRDPL